MKKTMLLAVVASGISLYADFVVDKSVMSNKYWEVWNDGVIAKLNADIEKYRKADASWEVDVSDGTEVMVEQTKHAFFFGAQIFNYNQLGKKEYNDRYKELFGTLFNSATVSFYWKAHEVYPYAPRFEEKYVDTEEFWEKCKDPKKRAEWRRPATDAVIDFLSSRGVRIHGHPMIWGTAYWMIPAWIWDDFCPAEEKRALEKRTLVKIPTRNILLPAGYGDHKYKEAWQSAWKQVFEQLSPDEVAQIVPTFIKNFEFFCEKRIRDLAGRYGSRVQSWDVVNESARDFARFQDCKVDSGVKCQQSVYGIMPGDYALKSFMWAKKYLPETSWLNQNDNYMSPAFYEQTKALTEKGCRIDVIGSQMHLLHINLICDIIKGEGPKYLRPEGVAARFEMLSKADRPIHLSEITIMAPDSTPQGEMAQAIIMRNLYRAWFAVEKMTGITWWNVVDGCGAPFQPTISGLFKRDMTPKAAYYAMDDLINREWKTKLSVKAEKGKVSFRGFRGEYTLTWKTPDGKMVKKLFELK
jgi:GH35 family endo-1,4-beta-xylanase